MLAAETKVAPPLNSTAPPAPSPPDWKQIVAPLEPLLFFRVPQTRIPDRIHEPVEPQARRRMPLIHGLQRLFGHRSAIPKQAEGRRVVEEAAAAAQQEAQNALNQDQVPRAYQNAVRDYFDDLKK